MKLVIRKIFETKRHSTHIILVQDATQEFPKSTSLEAPYNQIFNSIAVTYVEAYSNITWQKILQKIHFYEKGGIVDSLQTDAFLSHRQKTGQDIVLTLYAYLSKKFNVFLDVATSFETGNLQEIVSNTLVFIFVITEGIFESDWCFVGLLLTSFN